MLLFIAHIFFQSVFASLPPHPLHMTVTNIDIYDVNTPAEITIKFFKNDFEGEFNFKIDDQLFSNQVQKEKINRWINEQMQINSGDTQISPTIQSIESKADNSVLVGLTFDPPKTIHKLNMKFSFFSERFPDQKNLVFVHYKDQEEGLIFEKNKWEQSLVLD